MSSYGDDEKGLSEGCDDCAGVAEGGAVLEGGGVIDGGAGLAVIQDGALTVGFGGASGSLLN